MSKPVSSVLEELEEHENELGRGTGARPQRVRGAKAGPSPRLKVRSRKRPNNAAAKKGIHQRRNKRVNW